VSAVVTDQVGTLRAIRTHTQKASRAQENVTFNNANSGGS